MQQGGLGKLGYSRGGQVVAGAQAGRHHALCVSKVPRPSGVRRGWQRVFAALSDSRLLLFDAPDPRLSPASGALLQTLDLRWVPGRGNGGWGKGLLGRAP